MDLLAVGELLQHASGLTVQSMEDLLVRALCFPLDLCACVHVCVFVCT